jgi:hypothetical protein
MSDAARLVLGAILAAAAQDPPGTETVKYLRVAAGGAAVECTFRVSRADPGWSVESVTERGKAALTVSARYDAAGALLEARAVSRTGDRQRSVAVEVAEGKAKVRREGQDAQELEVPQGTIVTSAPDWTDTFFLARRYDRAKGGKQEFPGLWIHPVQPAQRLTFSVEKVGDAAADHGAEKLDLVRLRLRLRGNSEYAAWVDAAGRMIKLVSIPFKEGGTHLVREGFQKPAESLTP